MRPPNPLLHVTALACAALWTPTPAPAQEPVVAITGVHVVDVRRGTALPRRTVVIEDGRIRSVEENGAVPGAAVVVDGTGRYLIPGLWDMHAHVRHPAAPAVLLPQYLAHGVTGVRDMASDCDGPPEEGAACIARLREWRAAIEAGEMIGPRFLALSSFPLNPPWDYAVTEEQARGMVAELAGRGIDLLKVYYRLSPEAFAWFVDIGREHGLDAGGHIPLRMTVAEASAAGLRSLEHARDFLFDCFPGSAEFRAAARSQNPPSDVMRSMVDDHDPAICDATFRVMVENDTWYVPTHVTRRMDAFADDSVFRADPRRKYIPAPVWAEWQADADRMVALDPSPEGRRVVRGFYQTGLELTGRAHAAGVGIVLGTDAGDTYVFPGSGAHDELGELVKAGLTPAEALAAGTIRAAEFLRMEEDYGAIEPDKRADLVLLGADPLANIGAVREIEAVILGGRVFDRAALDAMLAAVEEAVADFEE
ncbi:MAG TPA: amidohydrolase family protein [Gemmatimonadota bacterium]|nr:amidohydrolase family protein [Gemmatimonadota bacterium]